jgi:hypothetical protein
MTSALIGRPLGHCWRHVGAAVTATMAAALSPPFQRRHCRCNATAAVISTATSTVSAAIATAFWLIDVCPRAASATATVACPHRCRCWLRTPLPLAPWPHTTAPCPLLFPPQLHDVQNITFNNLTPIRVQAGTKNSRPVDFLR